MLFLLRRCFSGRFTIFGPRRSQFSHNSQTGDISQTDETAVKEGSASFNISETEIDRVDRAVKVSNIVKNCGSGLGALFAGIALAAIMGSAFFKSKVDAEIEELRKENEKLSLEEKKRLREENIRLYDENKELKGKVAELVPENKEYKKNEDKNTPK